MKQLFWPLDAIKILSICLIFNFLHKELSEVSKGKGLFLLDKKEQWLFIKVGMQLSHGSWKELIRYSKSLLFLVPRGLSASHNTSLMKINCKQKRSY